MDQVRFSVRIGKTRNLSKIVSVLLSASVEKVGVSRMRDSYAYLEEDEKVKLCMMTFTGKNLWMDHKNFNFLGTRVFPQKLPSVTNIYKSFHSEIVIALLIGDHGVFWH